MTYLQTGRRVGPVQATVILLSVLAVYGVGFFILPTAPFILATVFAAITAVALVGSYVLFTDGNVPFPVELRIPRWFLGTLLLVGSYLLFVFDASVLPYASSALSVEADLRQLLLNPLTVVAAEQTARSIGRTLVTFTRAAETLWYVLLVAVTGPYFLSRLGYLLTGRSPRRYAFPVWPGTALLLFGSLLVVGRYVYELSLYELAMLNGLMVMAIFAGVLIPLGLWEIIDNQQSPMPVEPYPTVSVVIPAYNEEGSIGRCLDSILATNYPDEKREIIVVDDGSTDGTVAKVREYADRGVRVVSRPNGKRHAALNYGLFCSNGEYFVMLDADSVLEKDSLRIVAGALQADPELGGVAGDVRVMNTGRLITKIQAIEYVFSINSFRRACSFFDAVPIAPGGLSGFRREALEDVGGFDIDTIVEDFDTTVQILDHGWKVRQVSAIGITEAPFTWRDLYTQRVRWYSGGIQVVVKNRGLFMRSNSNYLHRMTFPYLALSFVFRPVVGMFATAAIVYGLLHSQNLMTLIGAVYFIALIGIVAAYVLYLLREPIWLLPWYVFLLVGYKQFIDFVFLRCIIAYVLGREIKWGVLKRESDLIREAEQNRATN